MRGGSEKRSGEGNKRGTEKPVTLVPYLKNMTPQAWRITGARSQQDKGRFERKLPILKNDTFLVKEM